MFFILALLGLYNPIPSYDEEDFPLYRVHFPKYETPFRRALPYIKWLLVEMWCIVVTVAMSALSFVYKTCRSPLDTWGNIVDVKHQFDDSRNDRISWGCFMFSLMGNFGRLAIVDAWRFIRALYVLGRPFLKEAWGELKNWKNWTCWDSYQEPNLQRNLLLLLDWYTFVGLAIYDMTSFLTIVVFAMLIAYQIGHRVHDCFYGTDEDTHPSPTETTNPDPQPSPPPPRKQRIKKPLDADYVRVSPKARLYVASSLENARRVKSASTPYHKYTDAERRSDERFSWNDRAGSNSRYPFY